MKKFSLILVALLFSTQAIMAGSNFSGEYESRTSVDKVNLWYRTTNLEVYVLKNTNLQIEIGPRFHVGPLIVTTRLGGVWHVADSTVNGSASVNLFLHFGRLTCLSVNDFTLDKISFATAYQEGFVLVDIPEIVQGFSLGVNFEHYQIAGEQHWVFGPRVTLNIEAGLLKSVSVWGGVTDNPTAGIFICF